MKTPVRWIVGLTGLASIVASSVLLDRETHRGLDIDSSVILMVIGGTMLMAFALEGRREICRNCGQHTDGYKR